GTVCRRRRPRSRTSMSSCTEQLAPTRGDARADAWMRTRKRAPTHPGGPAMNTRSRWPRDGSLADNSRTVALRRVEGHTEGQPCLDDLRRCAMRRNLIYRAANTIRPRSPRGTRPARVSVRSAADRPHHPDLGADALFDRAHLKVLDE